MQAWDIKSISGAELRHVLATHEKYRLRYGCPEVRDLVPDQWTAALSRWWRRQGAWIPFWHVPVNIALSSVQGLQGADGAAC